VTCLSASLTCGDIVFSGMGSAGTAFGEAIGCKDESKAGSLEESLPED
jgi:hypothetical protein